MSWGDLGGSWGGHGGILGGGWVVLVGLEILSHIIFSCHKCWVIDNDF